MESIEIAEQALLSHLDNEVKIRPSLLIRLEIEIATSEAPASLCRQPLELAALDLEMLLLLIELPLEPARRKFYDAGLDRAVA